MTEEIKLSYHDYAAIVFGPDADSTWLWCEVAEAGKVPFDKEFYCTEQGGWQVKVMPQNNMVMIMGTSQMLPNARLAYFGQVPAAVAGRAYPIYKHLRMSEYAGWPGYVDTGEF